MINEFVKFNEPAKKCFELISELQLERGVALADLVKLVVPWIGRLQMDASVACFLYDELSNLEHRLSFGVSERLQLGSLVAIFRQAADKMGDKANQVARQVGEGGAVEAP